MMLRVQELLVFSTISLVFFWILRRWLDRHKILLANKFPSHKIHLLSGFGFMLTSKGTVNTIIDAFKRFGKNCLCYIGPFPVVLTCDPETVKDVLNSKQCINKPSFVYGRLENVIGKGLITLEEPRWHVDRRIFNTAFNNKNLLSFIPIFNDEIKDLMFRIDKDRESGLNTPLIEFFREFTLHIATKTTIGRDMNGSSHDIKEIAKNMGMCLEYASNFTFNNLYVLGLARNLAQATIFRTSVRMKRRVLKIITDTFGSFATKRGEDPSFLTNINTAMDYISTGMQQNKIKSEHIPHALFHIFIGAYETTSTSMFFMLLMLGMYPECQDRVYEEVCSIFPGDDDEDFEVTYENIGDMVYLDMLMNETLRVLPVIPHIYRQVRGGPLTLSNGNVLPNGQTVLVDLVSLHRSKEVWGPDAHKFNPDNFLPSNVEARHPYAFIPFTKGVRFCIGWRYAQLSIKTAMARLIKRYKFSTDAKLEDLQIENHITSQLTIEPPLYLEKRKKTKTA